ncbi:MAG TPA: glycine--tRNA ligase subunit beta [bacterium]|nr:glycine--tRNA ligase subunit beta [bacterium]HPQ65777.1 glycine--tRNA ligase subunit beta [bacterium]
MGTDTLLRTNLLLEIGVEELPASYIAPALSQLAAFAAEYASPAKIRVLGTPRRLTLYAGDIPSVRPAVFWGPPVEKSREKDGSWNRSALGFARSRGAAVEELTVGLRKGRECLKIEQSLDTGRELKRRLPEAIQGLSFPKSMRWITGDSFRFARPLRWLLCLWGAEALEFEVAGLTAGRTTRGHRFFGEKEIPVPGADIGSYRSLLKAGRVIVDPAERRRKLADALLIRQRRYRAHARISDLDPDLLDEVLNLVEYPLVIEGGFEKNFLELPPEIPVTVMKKHQRYFPVFDGSGRLLQRFLIVANGPFRKTSAIRLNNEKVIRARLTDAEFFWKEDLSRPLPDRVADLEGVVFHKEAGSYLDKVHRLQLLAKDLGADLGLGPEDTRRLVRAAFLSKADLATAMVIEFTSLQGVMGREYARRGGEDERVARAIFEQYLPRTADDELPSDPVGRALALVDRLDTVCAFFQAGIRTTGSQDPYGLRRQVLGIIRILAEAGVDLDLHRALEKACRILGLDPARRRELIPELMDFFRTRLAVYFESGGSPGDLVRAVLASGWKRVGDARIRLEELTGLLGSRELLAAATIVERTGNISRSAPAAASAPPAENLLREASERRLFKVYGEKAPEIEGLIENGKYSAATVAYARCFSRPLSDFFRDVMVNVEERRLRENRMRLLLRIHGLYCGKVADLSLLNYERGEYTV